MLVTVIVGLPGSGKTHLAKEIARENPETVVVDDPKGYDDLAEIDDAASAVITHPEFCRHEARVNVTKAILTRRPDAEMRWIFFASEPDACRRNVEIRADGRKVDGYIRRLSDVYTIPAGADVRPVFRNRDDDSLKLSVGQ